MACINKYNVVQQITIICFIVIFHNSIIMAQSGIPQPTSKTTDKIRAGKRAYGLDGTSAKDSLTKQVYNLLLWEPSTGIKGYKLTRVLCNSRDSSFIGKPQVLNRGDVITIVDTCTTLKSYIKPGSNQWEALKKAMIANSSASSLKTGARTGITPAVSTATNLPKALVPVGKANQTINIKNSLIRNKLILSQFKDTSLCAIFQKGLTKEQMAVLFQMARVDLNIRMVAGLAYKDSQVKVDSLYAYLLFGVKGTLKDTLLSDTLYIRAGKFNLPAPPVHITAQGGDEKIQILWDRRTNATGYHVQRSTDSAGTYRRITAEKAVFDLFIDVKGDSLPVPRPGHLDFQHYTDAGDPVNDTVNGFVISGPKNGQKYWYRVASVDILGRTGTYSASISATPADSTPPQAPGNVSVTYVNAGIHGLQVQWETVKRDVKGHPETGTNVTYHIFRSDSMPLLDSIALLKPGSPLLVHSKTQAVSGAPANLSWVDNDSVLFPLYGEKDFWYRLVCVDTKGNISSPSASISGRVPDKTPPGRTDLHGIEGHEAYIQIQWKLNPEPDVAGYHIYRSVCDNGQVGSKNMDCDLLLLTEITKTQAEKMSATTGFAFYNDSTVPEASPLCYGYAVAAFDGSGNEFRYERCPQGAEYLCGRLIEETGPPPPVLTSIQARDEKIKLQWQSSPIQDLYAFHVYRSKKEHEPAEFIGCVFLDGSVKMEKWPGKKPDCGEIPAQSTAVPSKGSFIDSTVNAHDEYWYRIAGVDIVGNESFKGKIDSIPAISTFTYTKKVPLPPDSITVVKAKDTCGVVLSWRAIQSAHEVTGYMVFRSLQEGAEYRQISPVVKENLYLDPTVVKGFRYWYCIQSIDNKKLVSKMSSEASIVY